MRCNGLLRTPTTKGATDTSYESGWPGGSGNDNEAGAAGANRNSSMNVNSSGLDTSSVSGGGGGDAGSGSAAGSVSSGLSLLGGSSSTNGNGAVLGDAKSGSVVVASTSGASNSGGGGGVYPGPDGRMVEIKDVWASTLEQEMAAIREVVERYPYVAMDTEFPGVVAKPIGDAYSTGYQYQTLQCNVDLLKIIQLGISFCDGDGRVPETGCYCWQFNFRFDLNEDMYAEDSIQLLKESGIDFARHAAEGIEVSRFGELVMMSGLVLCDDVKWVSFHSGYDFGYLIKILTCQTLPSEEQGFFELLRTYFPVVYDVKLLMQCVDGLHGGLQRLAEDLKVERIGPMHQAGSDSLLTNATFFRLAEVAFQGVDQIGDKFCGEIYGLGAHAVHRGQKYSQQSNSNSAQANDALKYALSDNGQHVNGAAINVRLGSLNGDEHSDA